MQTVGGASHHLAEARAAGVHEFLAKPISAKALYACIRAIIEYPRPFIRTAEYFGPNHRWQQTEFDGEEQRRSPPRAADTDAWGQANVGGGHSPSADLTHEEIRALLSGGDDDRLFVPSSPEERRPDNTPEGNGTNGDTLVIPVPARFQLPVVYSSRGIDDDVVRQAEAVIEGFQDDYRIWGQEDLSRMQICFDRARATALGERAKSMQPVFDAAYDMARQGGTFGFPAITVIGVQLCSFIEGRAIFGETEMRAIRLHIDAMRVVLAGSREGDGDYRRDRLIGGLRAILARIGKNDGGGILSLGTGR
jgi:hypothetical protein